MLPLLGKTRVIEDQITIHAELSPYPGLQAVEHRLLVPRALIDELLQRLLIVFFAFLDLLQSNRHRLDTLALPIEQHATDIRLAPPSASRIAQGSNDGVQERR